KARSSRIECVACRASYFRRAPRENSHHRGARVDTSQRSDDHHAHPLQAGGLHARHTIMANLRVADVEATKSFYTDYLGLSTEEFTWDGWPAAPLPTPGRTSSS